MLQCQSRCGQFDRAGVYFFNHGYRCLLVNLVRGRGIAPWIFAVRWDGSRVVNLGMKQLNAPRKAAHCIDDPAGVRAFEAHVVNRNHLQYKMAGRITSAFDQLGQFSIVRAWRSSSQIEVEARRPTSFVLIKHPPASFGLAWLENDTRMEPRLGAVDLQELN